MEENNDSTMGVNYS